jgi:MoxR-like ATPases
MCVGPRVHTRLLRLVSLRVGFNDISRRRAPALSFYGRDYVAPDDVKTLAQPVLSHRLVLTSTAAVEGTTRSEVTDEALSQIDVPAMNVT